MGFFSKKKELSPQTPLSRPIATVIDDEPPVMEGEEAPEKKDEKEQEYEEYVDEEDVEEVEVINRPVESRKPQQVEEEQDDEEDMDEELLNLKRQSEQLQERIKQTKIKKEEEKRRREVEEQQPIIPQPNYVPVFMSESEYLREIMKEQQNVRLLLQQLISELRGGK